MIDLQFGDICIADLSKSLNSPKAAVVPLVFLSAQQNPDSVVIYKFCRVGKTPAYYTTKPYIEVGIHPYLRRGSAIYPTQTVLFSDTGAILNKVGEIGNEEMEKKILAVCEAARKEERQAIVMTLCPRCRKEFMMDSGTIVRRLDPFSAQQHPCDFCQTKNGYTYIIYKRRA